jgi:hypothetical protein
MVHSAFRAARYLAGPDGTGAVGDVSAAKEMEMTSVPRIVALDGAAHYDRAYA